MPSGICFGHIRSTLGVKREIPISERKRARVDPSITEDSRYMYILEGVQANVEPVS